MLETLQTIRAKYNDKLDGWGNNLFRAATPLVLLGLPSGWASMLAAVR
jgi:hypothetical protein